MTDKPSPNDDGSEAVPNPAALARVATMTQAMLDEAHATTLDEGGRQRLAEIHRRAVSLAEDAVSSELRSELQALQVPLSDGDASEAELRLAHSALIGWLNGLFLGLQMSAYHQSVRDAVTQQQLAAQRSAFEELARSGSYL